MTLQLTEGRYYRTRDGRKVGPAEPWTSTNTEGPYADCTWLADYFVYRDDGTFYNGLQPSHDIVAEWQDTPASPVRQITTTTRTEIVPGTYGHIRVLPEPNTGYVRLELLRQLATAEELRAAATTLNDLASALDAIAAERNAG